MPEPAAPIVIDESQPRHRRWWGSLSRRQQLLIGAGGVTVIGLIVWLAWPSGHSPIAAKRAAQKAAGPMITSPLTGVAVSAAQAARPVTGVMIENSPDARPQSGLNSAGVVFEAIAEGGITRFLALYQDSAPDYIGPVRSLRPYYIDWATGFDASIAHVGGSPDALEQIRNGGKDLDQFFNAGAYWRVASRPSPHDVYTNFSKLDALNQAKGYTSSHFNPWSRKADQPLAKPGASSIDLSISGPLYSVHYAYEAATNSYARSEGGAAHTVTDSEHAAASTQLHPKVVIALVMSYNVLNASGHSAYGTIGDGPCFIFQDGNVNTGTWHKTDRGSQFSFTDPSGNVIKLDAGQSWVSIVNSNDAVSYQP